MKVSFIKPAAKQLGKNKLYNKQDLKTKYSPTHEELDEAIEIICKAISPQSQQTQCLYFSILFLMPADVCKTGSGNLKMKF